MAVRALFGQKIRAERPSNVCADDLRIKKSELSVYQMAFQNLVPQSPVTAEALHNRTTLVCSLKLSRYFTRLRPRVQSAVELCLTLLT